MTAVPTNRANERDDKIEGDVAERERAPARAFLWEKIAPGAVSTERTNDLGIGASPFLPSPLPCFLFSKRTAHARSRCF